MVSIEVHFDKADWVSFIGTKDEAAQYLEDNPFPAHMKTSLVEIQPEHFPLIIRKTSKFEYFDFPGYWQIKSKRTPKSGVDYLCRNTFISVGHEDEMDLLPHYPSDPSPDDSELLEDYLSELGYEENLKELDHIFELYHEHSDLTFKSLIAEGYLSVFHQWAYDHACGNLPVIAESELLYPLEQWELLQQAVPYSEYCEAYIILLENSSSLEQKKKYLDKCLRLEKDFLGDCEVDDVTISELIAVAYHILFDFTHESFYWNKALQRSGYVLSHGEAKSSRLYSYLTLISPRTLSLMNDTPDFDLLCEEFELLAGKGESLETALEVVDAFQRLYRHWGEDKFPYRKLYNSWVEKARYWDPKDVSLNNISSAAQIFRFEGERLDSPELLLKAASLFQMIRDENQGEMEIYYLSQIYSRLGQLYSSIDSQASHHYSSQALTIYETNIEIVRGNLSLLIHYLEYVDNLVLKYNRSTQQSMIEKKLDLLNTAIQLGKGHYSSPLVIAYKWYCLLGDTDTAIQLFLQHLLVLELLMKDAVVALRDWCLDQSLVKQLPLLASVLDLFESINKQYYYNPPFKWESVKDCSKAQLEELWKERSLSLRKT
ncbi:hypothetical protein [Spirochaeta cellobiosiphila]|uniref:hypothetical protein n=1 Tax=Spirochaeta cellobiosiphila TaxID=504483 RepID=UPI0003F8D379|nr:hypothetical protein [Spirochaeta cellobiosiphila]